MRCFEERYFEMRRYLLIVIFFGCCCFPEARGQQCEELYPWRLGFEMGVAVPTGRGDEGLRPCFAAWLQGGYDVGEPGGWFVSGSVGHQRTLHSKGPDYESVPMDSSLYLRKYVLYPMTVGTGYEFRPSAQWLRVNVVGEVGAVFCYQTFRSLVSVTETDVYLYEMGRNGWGFAGCAGVEAVLWNRVGIGVRLMAFGRSAGRHVASEGKKGTQEELHEVFDRHEGKLGNWKGTEVCLTVTYRF